jgi:hypothetical protein
MVAFWTHRTAVGRFAGMKGSLAHRLVALAAAYAVAFNALLPVVAAVFPASAAAGFGIICSTDAAGGSSDHGVPVSPQPACPCPGCCAMPGCGAAAPPSDDVAIDRAIGAGVTLVHFASAVAGLQGLRPAGSNRARAPPVA